MKLLFIKIPLALIVLGVLLFLLLYYAQEKLIFFPSKLSKEHRFTFKTEFEEHFIPSGSEQLHSLLFTKPEPKATTEYDLHILHSDIVIYSHLRNLVVTMLQRQLSKMKIDFALEP